MKFSQAFWDWLVICVCPAEARLYESALTGWDDH